MTDIVERLLTRAERLKKQNFSCQRICDLLAPEMAKFDARDAPWDTYTVRMAVDHQSSIRTQQKEIDDLTEAANEISSLRAAIAAATEGGAG